MKKLILIILCLGLGVFSYAHADIFDDVAKETTEVILPDFLSDENMLTYENVILFLIINDMDFLALTKPVFLEKHLSMLKYIPDAPMENPTVEGALVNMSPKNTYERKGGDCEDLTIYTIARFFQAKSFDVGFMLLRNPKDQLANNSQHIVAVLLTEAEEIMVYDLTCGDSLKRLPLDQYLKMWKMYAPEFDAYRIHWFFSPAEFQPKEEKI